MGKNTLVANGNKITSEQIKCRRGFDAASASSDKRWRDESETGFTEEQGPAWRMSFRLPAYCVCSLQRFHFLLVPRLSTISAVVIRLITGQGQQLQLLLQLQMFRIAYTHQHPGSLMCCVTSFTFYLFPFSPHFHSTDSHYIFTAFRTTKFCGQSKVWHSQIGN